MGRNQGDKLLVVPSDRTRGNGPKLKKKEVQSEDKKALLIVRVVKLWNRLPRGAVESPSVKIFKT